MAEAVAGSIDHRIATVVDQITEELAHAGMPMAREEARDIVATVLDVPRFWPSLHREHRLNDETHRRVFAAAACRARGVPFAYAVGRAAFRHLTLEVDERVLIPRQETEQLVDLVLQRGGGGGTAVDVGTGSGAIALALASEGCFDRVIATDVSLDALEVARRNIALLSSALRVRVELRAGSLLAPLAGARTRVVVSNPPYIALREANSLPSSVRDWEPALALYGGEDGLDVSLALVDGAPSVLEPGGLLALESDESRAPRVAEYADRTSCYRSVEVERDLAGRERFVLAWAR